MSREDKEDMMIMFTFLILMVVMVCDLYLLFRLVELNNIETVWLLNHKNF